jgi:hypothetical protein
MPDFAAQFTRQYDDVAARYPQFERLRTLAKLVQLAKWLVRQPRAGICRQAVLDALAAQGLPTDGFRCSGPLPADCSGKGARVPRLSVSRSTDSYCLTLSSGIRLEAELIVQQAARIAAVEKRLADAAAKRRRDACTKIRNGVVFPLNLLASMKAADEMAADGEQFIARDPVVARDIGQAAVMTCGDSRRAHMLLGRAFAELGSGREAISEFVRAARASQTSPELMEAQELAEREAAILATKPCELIDVGVWAGLFPVCVPVDWVEVTTKQLDSTYSRIFASVPSRYVDVDRPEMLLVTEMVLPDFTDLIRAWPVPTVDVETKLALYQIAAPEVFANLENPKVERLAITEWPMVTFVSARVSGKVNQTTFVYQHLFVIPNHDLVPNGIGLLMIASSLDYHASWMGLIAHRIFEAVQTEVRSALYHDD